MLSLVFVLFLQTSLPFIFAKYRPCVPKDFGHGSVVCVCTATYCDGFEDIPRLRYDEYLVYTSTKSGMRFNEAIHTVQSLSSIVPSREKLRIKILAHTSKQSILGFGGAVTDSSSKNILDMPQKLQDRLFESYFSPQGIGYSFLRIPMASCDFSPRVYSYDKSRNDFSLANFSLTGEDTKLKIPVIKKALLYNDALKLFASPWSAPAWLKTSESMIKAGSLKGVAGDKYHKTWANYFVKFLQAYEQQGLPRMWGLTVQNEPNDALIKSFSFQNMGFTPATERDFIKKDLGPILAENGFGDIKLMILDDNRCFMHTWTDVILGDADAKKYIKGVAYHWYVNFLSSPVSLDLVHKKFPDVFLLSTEACAGFLTLLPGVILGSWERGEDYSHDILQNLNHWSAGWVEWNLVLNREGGPNWTNHSADSTVITNPTTSSFFKQPTFYHLGHFSTFITPGSLYIDSLASQKTQLEFAAFARSDRSTVLVVLNRWADTVSFIISESTFGEFETSIPGRAIQTYILGPSEGR